MAMKLTAAFEKVSEGYIAGLLPATATDDGSAETTKRMIRLRKSPFGFGPYN